MKISAFTLVRNGLRFDYPFLESIRSLLPLVDELLVNVGVGDDSTLSEIQNLAQKEKKIIFFESDWQLDDPKKKKGGLILSEQSNLALERCSNDWCIYLQADEVLHEEDHLKITQAIRLSENRPEVEGLLFDYVHFYGSYDVFQYSRSAYRREVRAIRKSSKAQSIGDAQSFRKKTGEKLQVIPSGARVFHYGWVRTPEAMKEKTFFMDQLYHGNPSEENKKNSNPHTGDNYRYKKILGLYSFSGTHPQVMRERIRKKVWHWDLKNSPLIYSYKDIKKIILDGFEKFTGIRLFEYRSYKRIK